MVMRLIIDTGEKFAANPITGTEYLNRTVQCRTLSHIREGINLNGAYYQWVGYGW